MDPATLNQALREIASNRMVAVVVGHPWPSAGVYLLLSVTLAVLAPVYLCVLLAPFGFLLVALLGYFAAERLFVAKIRAHRPRCPSCKEVIWQLMCEHCRQPIPLLTLLYRGWFLSHCPHCDGGLSDRDGSLKAWCHCCGTRIWRPRRHYARPSVVEIELSAELPAPLVDGWTAWPADGYQEFHRAEAKSFTILYRVRHDRDLHTVVPGTLLGVVARIWIGGKVNPLVCSNALASIPRDARSRAELCFEEAMPGEVDPRDWRRVRGNVPRPDRGCG